MKLEIYNNSTYKNIKIICNNKEYSFNDLQKSLNIITTAKAHVKILILEKNSFRFNLPSILTNSFTHKDSWCYIKCNLEFDIETKNEICKIEVSDNRATFKSRYIFESLKIDAFDVSVTNIRYSQTDTIEVIKKHKKFNLLLTSLFPIILINFVLCIIDQDIMFLFAGLLCFLFFSIPSFVDIKKFNKICKDSNIAQTVLLRTENTGNGSLG